MADTWDSPSTGYTGGGPTSGPSTSYNGTTGDYGEYSDNGTGNNSGVGYGSTPSSPSTNYGGPGHSYGGSVAPSSSPSVSTPSSSVTHGSPGGNNDGNDSHSYTVPSVYSGGGSVNATPVTYGSNGSSGGGSSPSWNGGSIGTVSVPKDFSFTLKETSSGHALSRAMEGSGGGEFKLDIPTSAFGGSSGLTKTDFDNSSISSLVTDYAKDFASDAPGHFGTSSIIEGLDRAIIGPLTKMVTTNPVTKGVVMTAANSTLGNAIMEDVKSGVDSLLGLTTPVTSVTFGTEHVPMIEVPADFEYTLGTSPTGATFGQSWQTVPAIDFKLDFPDQSELSFVDQLPGSLAGNPLGSSEVLEALPDQPDNTSLFKLEYTHTDFNDDAFVSIPIATFNTLATPPIMAAGTAISGGNPIGGFLAVVGMYSTASNVLTEPLEGLRDLTFEALGLPAAPEDRIGKTVTLIDIDMPSAASFVDPKYLDPTYSPTKPAGTGGDLTPEQIDKLLDMYEEQARPSVVTSEVPSFPGKDADDGVISMPRPSIVVSSADNGAGPMPRPTIVTSEDSGPKPRPDIQISSADDDAPAARPTVTTKPATGGGFKGDEFVFNDTSDSDRPGSSLGSGWSFPRNEIQYEAKPNLEDGDGVPWWLINKQKLDTGFDLDDHKPTKAAWDDFESPLALDVGDFGRSAFGDSLL